MEETRLEPFWFTLLHKNDSRELWHPELEIVFLLRGTGRIYFSDLKTTYTLREKDIFAVNGFEIQDFELDGEAAALSFSISPGFISDVAPELLKYRVNCRSFLYEKQKQAAFDVLRQDLARTFQAHYKKEKPLERIPPSWDQRTYLRQTIILSEIKETPFSKEDVLLCSKPSVMTMCRCWKPPPAS